MTIEFNTVPVAGEVVITAEEQEIRFPSVYRLVVSIYSVDRVQISLNNNLNYVTYRWNDGKAEIYNAGGIDKIFIKTDSFVCDGSKLCFWGYR